MLVTLMRQTRNDRSQNNAQTISEVLPQNARKCLMRHCAFFQPSFKGMHVNLVDTLHIFGSLAVLHYVV